MQVQDNDRYNNTLANFRHAFLAFGQKFSIFEMQSDKISKEKYVYNPK